MSNLKKIRELREMTQAELADKSGVNVRMIQHYEQGTKDIKKSNVITALSLSEALGCDIREIL
jgi:transcriptional regulator with XRE-family HTH domain